MHKKCSLLLIGLVTTNSFCMEIAPKSASIQEKKITTPIMNGDFAILPKEIILEILKILFKDARTGKEFLQVISLSQLNKFFRNLFKEDSAALKNLWKIADFKLHEIKSRIYIAQNKQLYAQQTLPKEKLSKKAILESLKELSKAVSGLLHKEEQLGSNDIILLALNNGAKIDERDSSRKTPLMIAASLGYKEIVEILISHGANVKAKNDKGNTPLMLAVMQGHKEVALLLINKGANVNEINKYGENALMFAASFEYEEIVKLLISEGTIIDKKDFTGSSALTWATKNDMGIAEILMKHGAKLDDENSKALSAQQIEQLQGIATRHGLSLFK